MRALRLLDPLGYRDPSRVPALSNPFPGLMLSLPMLSRAVAVIVGVAPGLGAVGSAAAQDDPTSVEVHRTDRVEAAQDGGDPRVVLELITDHRAVAAGAPFRVGVRFILDDEWHVYWRNPGQAGMATEVTFASAGASFEPLEWPLPARFVSPGPIVTYAYADEVVLLAQATVHGDPGAAIDIEANADFLVCKVDCIPGRATLSTTLSVGEAVRSDGFGLLSRFASRVPVSPDEAGVEVDVEPAVGGVAIRVRCRDGACAALSAPPAGAASAFFSGRDGVRELTSPTRVRSGDAGGAAIEVAYAAGTAVSRAEHGPPRVEGVVHLVDEANRDVLVAIAADDPSRAPSADAVASLRDGPALRQPGRGRGESALSLVEMLLFALLGGLILNLMPCVFPMLAIKAYGIVHLASAQSGSPGRRTLLQHALGYLGGVLAAMLALASVVIAVRAAGVELGWGFQFQEPLFVTALATILVVFALNFFGVFEIPAVGAATLEASLGDRLASSRGPGRSVGEGILAVVLATPCSAPFLGTAVGFALASSTATIVAVFTAIGVGLALPVIVLAWVPGAARLLPRPGPWMTTFKVVLGFFLLATVVWLVWLVGQHSGVDAIARLLAFLLAVAATTWVLGTYDRGGARPAWRRWLVGGVAIAGVVAVGLVALRFEAPPARAEEASRSSAPWAPATVEAALAEGHTVFVVFTADWCITCKANERLVLETETVRSALHQDSVVTLVADWTRRDEAIRAELARYGKAGVPMYLVFSPHRPREPEVLPELLTEAIVVAALERADRASLARRDALETP